MLPLPPELMTIRELKAHLDRRFDRLERTKADRTELRRLAAKSDRRWAATTRAFKRFATKDDLRRFATKDDLRRFATKDDLKRFATKDDLKCFATKDDLKRFATRDDLRRFAAKDDLRGLATKADLARLEERVIALHKTLQNMLPHHGRILDDHERRIVDLEQGG
jgi:hypothetical protein